MNRQLTLDLDLREDFTFSNFEIAANTELLKQLSALKDLQSNGLFMQGIQGAGKTHLLNAVCYAFSEQFPDQQLAYLPLKEAASFTSELLQGLQLCQLVCLDDIHQVIGHIEWETALFELINGMHDNGHKLLVSSAYAQAELDFALKDLASRLGQLTHYTLHALDEVSSFQVLQNRAHAKGIKLESEFLNYVQKRGPRDIASLMDLLETLEKRSLQEKRLITVPFLKTMVDW